MLPADYQSQAARTEASSDAARQRVWTGGAEPSDVPIRLLHACLGLQTEAGEIADPVKRHLFYGQPLDRLRIKEEVGDLCWYVALACNALGLDLGELMTANIAKLKARFPDKFTEHHAAEENRDRSAEARALRDTDPDIRNAAQAMREASILQDTAAEVLGSEIVGKRDVMQVAQELIKRHRTVTEVLTARAGTGESCCDRYAAQQGCDCLERAQALERYEAEGLYQEDVGGS